MKLSSLQYVLWLAGFIGDIALLFVLIYRKGMYSFPVFTSWMAFQIVRTAVLFESHAKGLDHLYANIYWYSQIPEWILVFGTAWEIVRHVLRPDKRWSRGVLKPFIFLALGAIALSLLITIAVRPTYPKTLFGWFYPSNLFGGILNFELGVAVLLTANRFGLAWRDRVTGLAVGWMIWSFLLSMGEVVRRYLPDSHLYTAVGQIKIYAYFVALALWISAFWRREPERKPMTAEMYALFSSTFVELSKDVESEKLP